MKTTRTMARWILALGVALAFGARADEVRDLEERLAQTSGVARLPVIVSWIDAHGSKDAERTIALAREGLELLGEAPDSETEIALSLGLAAAYAQTQADDEARRYGQRAVELGRDGGETSRVASTLLAFGKVLEGMQDYPGALEAFREAEGVYVSTGDLSSQAEAIRSQGITYFRDGEHERAVQHFLRAKAVYAEAGDELGEARALSNVGSVHNRIRQFDEAHAAFREALSTYRRLGRSDLVASILNNMGIAYTRSGDPARAAEHFRQALDAMEGIDNPSYLASMYNNLGMSLKELEEAEAAIENLQRALEIRTQLGQRRAKLDTLIHLAGAYSLRGDSELALKTALQARDAALEVDSRIDLENAYKTLAKLYEEAGRYREALEAFQWQQQFVLERYDESQSALVAEMTARFESDQKQAEIERLEQSQRLARLEMQRQQGEQRFVIGGSLGLILLTLGLGYAFWQRRTAARERDVSQRLRQVDKLKDEFLANTSHELRTPLNGIIGLADSLIDGATGALPEATKSNLSMIVHSGQRLSHLVNDILDFSKMRHKSLELDLQPVDLHPLVDVVLTLSRPLVGAKALELENLVPRDLPAVMADENRLQQILHNLVGNAIKFTESGSVEISASFDGKDGVAVRVSDTGIGIPEEKQQRIFDAFEQADASVEREYGGTGLGLAVTRQLVELHGGDIRVESRPGEGAVFSFTLPRAEVTTDVVTDVVPLATPIVGELADVATGQDVMTPAPGAPRILAVDDDPINRQVLRNYLADGTFDVTLAESGSQALELLEQESFDLVLLDIMMPGQSGYEVCRTLRESRPLSELPVLFLTAKSQDADLVMGMELGGNDYLTKPISKERLLARVRPHLDLLDVHRNLEDQVQEKLAEVKVLRGLLPICAGCKKIRSNEGDWNSLESYIDNHSEASFTHGICPDCVDNFYDEHPELGAS